MPVFQDAPNLMGQHSNPEHGQLYIAKLNEIRGFTLKPVASQGSHGWEFECAGIITHCRPLQFGRGLEVRFLELGSPISNSLYVVQPDKGKLCVELVTAMGELSVEYHRQRTLKLSGMEHLI